MIVAWGLVATLWVLGIAVTAGALVEYGRNHDCDHFGWGEFAAAIFWPPLTLGVLLLIVCVPRFRAYEYRSKTPE